MFTSSRYDDHPHPLLLLWQGLFSTPLNIFSLVLTYVQVTGDMWERYLKLIDDGMSDGYGYIAFYMAAHDAKSLQ